mmetsp:Transcript_78689/g.122822  ORF Transcript_78689/g.122822 Transcript_78689/m.122822 type:complete len:305 (+) Transcript_78689:94-1008(+)
MRQRFHETLKSFFFAPEDRESNDHLVELVRREPEVACWFIELTMMFSAVGGTLAFLISSIFLCMHWDRCSSCDRPLRWWLLMQSLLQLGQLPVRAVTIWTVRDIRQNGGELEASVKSITGSQAWQCSRIVSLALYGWFILGVVWWIHSSSCDGCPGIVILSAGVMILSVARAVLAMGAFVMFFPCHYEDMEIQPAEAPKIEAASRRQINELELVYVPKKKATTGSDEGAESCAVCLADISGGDVVRRLPCRHQFHMACIDKWLHRNKRCPLCMHPIDEMATTPSALVAKPHRRSVSCTLGRDST